MTGKCCHQSRTQFQKITEKSKNVLEIDKWNCAGSRCFLYPMLMFQLQQQVRNQRDLLLQHLHLQGEEGYYYLWGKDYNFCI